MPRKNSKEYRQYMRDYMRRKRAGLRGINRDLVEARINTMVGGTVQKTELKPLN